MIQSTSSRVSQLARLMLLLLPGCFILVACSGKPAPVTPITPTTALSVPRTMTPVVALIQSVTVTSIVTYTPTPDFTRRVTAKATSTLSPTPTPRPTLSEDQAWVEVYAQLHAQNPCRFPCWWGLQPGKTTFEEAREFYRRLGFEQPLSAPPYVNKRFVLGLPNGPAGDKFRIQISTQMYDKALGTMEIWARQGEQGESDMFYQYLEPYSIEHVIAMYGKPNRVLIHSPSYYGENHIRGDGGNYAFDIALFYDAVGALISYRGEPSTFISGGKQALVCPQLQDTQVDSLFINLRAPDDAIPLARLAPRYRLDENYLVPLEEISRLTLDDFITAVTKSKQACFSILTQ